jgi:membrane protein YdbS with pleckstrin-like domain
MQLLARLFLIVPSIIAGWFVSEDDTAYWVVAFAIAMVFVALTIAFELYVMPRLQRRFRR